MNAETFRDFLQPDLEHSTVYFFEGEFSSAVIARETETLRAKVQESGASGPVSRKVFSTFVELAQNIHHYAARNESANPQGSLSVVLHEGSYWVMCSNRMPAAHVTRLQEKLDRVRAMSPDEIKLAYKTQLKNEDHAKDDISRGAGLGWLTIARDAKAPLEYTCAIQDDPQIALFQVKAVI
jgi:Family of unknown function (DUF6272)